MKKSQRRILASSLVLVALLAFAVNFGLLPWLQKKRDLQARRDAQRTLSLLILAEKKFAAKTGRFTDNLSALKPWLAKIQSNQKLHYGFNPECLTTSGTANSIGLAAQPDLVTKLQGMFSELPCSTRATFTAMVAIRTSQQLEIFVSDLQDEVASMTLTDHAGEGATEVASFRLLLGSLRSAGTTSGSTSSPSKN